MSAVIVILEVTDIVAFFSFRWRALLELNPGLSYLLYTVFEGLVSLSIIDEATSFRDCEQWKSQCFLPELEDHLELPSWLTTDAIKA